MAGAAPPAAFGTTPLEIYTISPGERFGRVYLGRHPNPLGFGKTPSRFSDPRRRVPASRFGVIYLGESLTVCFLEAVLRDQRDGLVGNFAMAESELHDRLFADIKVAHELRLVDLRDECAIRMGVPTDVHRGSKQTLARSWSIAFHDHPDSPDGIDLGQWIAGGCSRDGGGDGRARQKRGGADCSACLHDIPPVVVSPDLVTRPDVTGAQRVGPLPVPPVLLTRGNGKAISCAPPRNRTGGNAWQT